MAKSNFKCNAKIKCNAKMPNLFLTIYNQHVTNFLETQLTINAVSSKMLGCNLLA